MIGLGISIPKIAINSEGGSLASLISSLFRNNEQGVWYDPSDMSTMFQDATGTTPVTAMEQPVGLILDKSRGLVQTQLITNGTFDANIDGWSTVSPTTALWSSGRILVNRDGYFQSQAATPIRLIAGNTYFVSIDVTSAPTNAFGGLEIWDAGRTTARYLVGTFRRNTAGNLASSFVATTTEDALVIVGISGATTGQVTFDNISVRELPGNHATQSTSVSRPVLSARYNMLTNTENISLFSAQNATISGSVFTVTATGAANVNRIYSIGQQPSGTSFTTSVKLKRVNANWVAVQVYNINNAIGVICYVNLGAGVLGFTNVSSAGGTVALAPIAGEVNSYRLSMTFPSNYAFSSPHIFVRGASADGNLTCAGGESYEVSQFDLRVTNDGVGLPAYQRVNTATDYDTTGFKPYLRFDGTDDWMQTNAIDFTGTDKMTVFAGVRKLSDAATGMVAELSASSGGANGSFNLTAPNTTGYGWRSVGTLLSDANSTGTSAPESAVLTGIGNIAADISQLRRNSLIVANSTADQGTGNYGNYPLYIGRRGGTSLPFNGRIYSLIIRGAQSRDDQITQTEKFVASKTGINYVMPTIDYLVSEDNNILNTEDSNRIII